MKSFDEILALLKQRFVDSISEERGEKGEPFIRVDVGVLKKVMEFLRSDSAFSFDSLMLLSGIDYPEKQCLAVAYHIFSMKHRHRIFLKVFVPRDVPHVPTVSDIWPTANWHEREAYDLFGIVFEGHPNLRRILCPDDWEGHTLRKDYKEPATYRGIPL